MYHTVDPHPPRSWIFLLFFRGPLKWAAFRRLRTDGGGFWATDGTGLQDGWLAEEDTNRGMKKKRDIGRRGFFSKRGRTPVWGRSDEKKGKENEKQREEGSREIKERARREKQSKLRGIPETQARGFSFLGEKAKQRRRFYEIQLFLLEGAFR